MINDGHRANARIDPIQLELIRHGLIAVAEEMKLNLRRTAYNPIIYEVLDFSCGVLDARARMIAQADGLPIFLGNLGTAARCVMEDIGLDQLEPGDLYLFNDPYRQGNHVNDVTTVLPVFDDAGDLAGIASTRAHWLEIGGKDPGGSIDATDVMQEGLWFGSVRVCKGGVIDRDVWRMIECNIRTPQAMLGDLRAQIAASRTGEHRLAELIRAHGREVFEAAVAEMHRQGEARARQALAAIPDGRYEAESFLDDDCLGNGPLAVRVAAIIEGDSLTIDLTGSARENPGVVNCGLPATHSAARLAVKMFTNPEVPACEGDFAPLELIVPEDSMFNARYPAPTFMYGTHLILLADVIVRALGQALPDKAVGGHYGNLSGFMLVGNNPWTGDLYIQQEPEVGGWGASPAGDGENALIFMCDGDVRILSAEILESRFPLRLERLALRPDSGGPGRHRGGLGIVRDYRLLGHDAHLTAIMDRTVAPPEGVAGGRDAMHCRVVIREGDGDDESVYQKPARMPLRAETVVSVQTGGGGGWGDPAERDVQAVLTDLRNGYISPAGARDDYGVAIDGQSSSLGARKPEAGGCRAGAQRGRGDTRTHVGERVRVGGRFEEIASYSRAARAGDLIAVSATAALGPDGVALHPGDAGAQMRVALDRSLAAVEALGGDREHVIRTRIFLAPGADWRSCVEVHGEVFRGVEPANTTLFVAGFIPEGCMVEVEVDAVVR